MRPGLRPGAAAEWVITVTEDQCPSFEGEGRVIHRALSTVAMIHHMEWVARRVILPYLEEGEEGIGGGVSVRHLAPAPVGKTVRFRAEAAFVSERRVDCRVWAEHDRALVGEGEVVQFILPKQVLEARIRAMD
ncbi:thioesterase [Alicyclobacillus sp.]|uniref:thioesterase family protein n=1 Tax=Alicyclobacillus sp. TaxID=61169 RepID=UPI0025BC9627|nr:thioesterase [Alicyclobacillus sp.]MCL6517270.1 thioesterase [Alicyclobacillus sp.]